MQNYDINYDDDRFKQVESQKQEQLNNINNTYNNIVSQSDSYYQNLVDATNKYAETQQKNQQANTDFAIEQINQQKEQAHGGELSGPAPEGVRQPVRPCGLELRRHPRRPLRADRGGGSQDRQDHVAPADRGGGKDRHPWRRH